MRYVVEVARQRNFSRAAEQLHVAQQALSQQVKTVETMIGVTLFNRTNRGVELTPAGVVFVQEARRAIAAADRTVTRTQAVANGHAGSLRVAYTLATVYDTLPRLSERVQSEHAALKLELREVFGGDVPALLSDGRYDTALCPRMLLTPECDRQEVRHEPFVLALSSGHHLAARKQVTVHDCRGELFELWPREMAPGYHDAVIGVCRGAGFEPRLDEQAAGSTVWGNIAQGRGVGLVVSSLIDQLPRGITLVPLTEPAPMLLVDLVWHRETVGPAVEHLRACARAVAHERRWLRRAGLPQPQGRMIRPTATRPDALRAEQAGDAPGGFVA